MREVDLAFWRDPEDIASDKRGFMSDGEWELLSVPSRYWRLHVDDQDYAHIQFNVSVLYKHCHSTLMTVSLFGLEFIG